MIPALARPPVARLFRTPRSLLAAGAWCVLALGFALAARSRSTAHGADHVLLEAYAAVVLPLLAYSLVGAVAGPRPLGAAIAPLVLFGASPGRAALVTVGVAVAACAFAGALLAASIAAVAHGAADPPAPGDALASAYAGALGGATYAAWLSLGASFGKRGVARATLLVLDWLLGTGHGALSIVTPRAHLRNLLGGAAPLDWSGRASAVALLVLTLTCGLLAARRAAVAARA